MKQTKVRGRCEVSEPTWETQCPKRNDRIHCTCWYDGDECCACGDPASVLNDDGTSAGVARGPHPVIDAADAK